MVGRDSELMIPGLAGVSGREAELLEQASDIGAGFVTFYYGGLLI